MLMTSGSGIPHPLKVLAMILFYAFVGIIHAQYIPRVDYSIFPMDNTTFFYENRNLQNTSFIGAVRTVSRYGHILLIQQGYDICKDAVYFSSGGRRNCLDFCNTNMTTQDSIWYNYCAFCDYPGKQQYLEKLNAGNCTFNCNSDQNCGPGGRCYMFGRSLFYCDCTDIAYQGSLFQYGVGCNAHTYAFIPLFMIYLHIYANLGILVILFIFSCFILLADLVAKFWLYYDLRTLSTLFITISIGFSVIQKSVSAVEGWEADYLNYLLILSYLFFGMSYATMIILWQYICDYDPDDVDSSRDLSLKLKIYWFAMNGSFICVGIITIYPLQDVTIRFAGLALGYFIFIVYCISMSLGFFIHGIRVYFILRQGNQMKVQNSKLTLFMLFANAFFFLFSLLLSTKMLEFVAGYQPLGFFVLYAGSYFIGITYISMIAGLLFLLFNKDILLDGLFSCLKKTPKPTGEKKV